ncbi:unnamed protein product [Rotaria sordida]|uniref:Uncharacterized protein n=1 Tax=Rotaria sordida TaxID=392033 RepID=A0A814IJ49_9BILA|nr:unnamed protein product [Rotaria sordida]CAF1320498.1 unnamed protein product [Rotaria sordida]
MKKKFRSTPIIEEEHNSTSESEDDVRYDITTSIEESGGIENFLQSPTMILYKKNLRNQGSQRGDNHEKTKCQTESSTDGCENKRSGNQNHGKEKSNMKNVDGIGGEKINVNTDELVEDLEEDAQNTDEDEVRDEYIDETNDIQSVEITKERANNIVQLISTCVVVVTNPHYVASTAKRPIFEYYGANFKLSEIYPTKSIPIPNEILISYKKKKVDRYEKNEKEKGLSVEMTNKDPGLCDNEDIHESVEVDVIGFHGGIDMDSIDNKKKKGNKQIEQLNKNNSDKNGNNVNAGVATKGNVVICTDAPVEKILDNNISLFVCLKEVADGKSDETFYKNVGSSSTPIKQQDKSLVSTPATRSSPCAGETISSITIDTTSRILSQNIASSIDLPEVIKNYELVKPSSTSASPNSKTSTNNKTLSANIEDSDPLHSTTSKIIHENSSPIQKVISPQLNQKEVIVEQVAVDETTSKSNKRKSFGFRPTTKKKREQLTSVAKSS